MGMRCIRDVHITMYIYIHIYIYAYILRYVYAYVVHILCIYCVYCVYIVHILCVYCIYYDVYIEMYILRCRLRVPIPRKGPMRVGTARRTPSVRLKSSEFSSRIHPDTSRKWPNKPGQTRSPSRTGKWPDSSVFSSRLVGASRWARPGPRRRCNWCRRSRVCRQCIRCWRYRVCRNCIPCWRCRVGPNCLPCCWRCSGEKSERACWRPWNRCIFLAQKNKTKKWGKKDEIIYLCRSETVRGSPNCETKTPTAATHPANNNPNRLNPILGNLRKKTLHHGLSMNDIPLGKKMPTCGAEIFTDLIMSRRTGGVSRNNCISAARNQVHSIHYNDISWES